MPWAKVGVSKNAGWLSRVRIGRALQATTLPGDAGCPADSPMNVLLIGSGGREHAIAESLLRSPRLGSLDVAPGNAGTHAHNVALDVSDERAVVEWCHSRAVDLAVIGPELPLVNGLADELRGAGIACFGPTP